MPKKMGQGLAAKVGSKLSQAVKAHANDETKMGIVDLPPGITNGICQLVDCRFSQYKSGTYEGEYFFLAAGVVITPESVTTKDGVIPVKGLRTQIMRPVCDTTNGAGKVTTTDEHIAWILNEMRKLGVDTSELDAEDLEQVAADLKESKPYFRFSTTQGKATPAFPNPRTWENWNGSKGLEDYDPESSEEDEFDEEVESPTIPDVEEEEETEEEPSDDADEESSDDDLDALAAAAEAEDEEAGVKLESMAAELGLDEDEVANAESWTEVARMIREAQASGGEAEEDDDIPFDLRAAAAQADEDGASEHEEIEALCETYGIDSSEYSSWDEVADAIEAAQGESSSTEEDDSWEPVVEEIYFFKPPRAHKSQECEVKTVNKAARTVTLERLDDKKTFNKVPWDKLESE